MVTTVYILVNNHELLFVSATIHITSFHSCPDTSSKDFGEKLLEALEDIKQLLAKK